MDKLAKAELLRDIQRLAADDHELAAAVTQKTAATDINKGLKEGYNWGYDNPDEGDNPNYYHGKMVKAIDQTVKQLEALKRVRAGDGPYAQDFQMLGVPLNNAAIRAGQFAAVTSRMGRTAVSDEMKPLYSRFIIPAKNLVDRKEYAKALKLLDDGLKFAQKGGRFHSYSKDEIQLVSDMEVAVWYHVPDAWKGHTPPVMNVPPDEQRKFLDQILHRGTGSDMGFYPAFRASEKHWYFDR